MSEIFRPMALYADSVEIAVERRMRVQGRSNMTLLPDFFTIDIYNVSENDKSILKNTKKIDLRAENNSMICYGSIVDIYDHPIGGDDVTTIAISDGQEFWDEKINVTIGTGIGMKETIRSIVKGIKFGAYLADNPSFIRGQTFVGSIPEVVEKMATAVNARAFIRNGALYVVGKGTTNEKYEITEKDVASDPSFANGVCVVPVKVQGYAVGSMIAFRNGLYRLVAQIVDADNFKGNWKIDLLLVNEDMVDSLGGW